MIQKSRFDFLEKHPKKYKVLASKQIFKSLICSFYKKLLPINWYPKNVAIYGKGYSYLCHRKCILQVIQFF